MAMTYTVFGHRISSLRLCNRYGLKESEIARCYDEADADKDRAAVLIERLIASKPESELAKEVGRRAGMRVYSKRHRPEDEMLIRLRGNSKTQYEAETDYWGE